MIEERFLLAVSRIKEITKEMEPGCGIEAMPEPFREYFGRMADFLILMADTYHYVEAGELYLAPVCELKERNRRLYEDILPENYGRSFANPEYSASKLGEDFGRLLSFLYADRKSVV